MHGLSFNESDATRHIELYFPDGDLILAARDTSKAVTLFRVHRFMLSRNSSVFADMFSLPANPQVNEMCDGVPVVEMADDVDDLEKLIGVLYSPA